MSTPVIGIRGRLFFFGLILAVGMVFSTMVAAGAWERVRSSDKTVSVKGYAERLITSDLGVWRGAVTVRGADLGQTYVALETDIARTVAWLEKAGVAKAEVGFEPVSMTIQYKQDEDGDQTNEIEGYVIGRAFDISSSDIALIARLASDSSILMREGIQFESRAPEYFYTKLDDLKIAMLGEAAKDARARAEQLVSASGSKVGPLRSAQQGVFQITPLHSTSTSDYGVLDTSTVTKSIKAVVTMEYAIK